MVSFLQIEAGACLLGAMCLYLLPVQWVLGALTAGVVHEIGHLMVLAWIKVPVYSITLRGMGAKIETGPMTPGQELICALAGPLCSFSMLFLCGIFPEAALWGLVQGLFNLLPLYPMDGGRVLRSILGKKSCWMVERISAVLLLGGSLWLIWRWNLGFSALIPAAALASGCQNRNISCKRTRKAVQ